MGSSPRSVAIIGAGLAGLMCARTLADHTLDVTVFEKSRGAGGRAATRRDGVWQFDHGAQYFTVRDARLAPSLHSWQQRGIVAPWTGALAVREAGAWRDAGTRVRRWVGVPGMSALGRHLAADLIVQYQTRVAHIQREGRQWRLVDDTGADLGTFDVVLTCVPAPQAHDLLAPVAPSLAARTREATLHATWATMLVLESRPDVAWEGAFLNDDPVLSWASRNAGKPGREAHETWVLHATRAWSAAHLEDAGDSVSQVMTEAFAAVIGAPIVPVHHIAHRWRYALPDPVVPDGALFDAGLALGAAGDWCGGPRIEGALLSGIALAGRVLATVRDTPPQAPLTLALT